MLQTLRNPKAQRVFWVIIALAFVGGFVFFESSGLFGRQQLTAGSAVATVNGTDIPYQTWANAVQNISQEREERLGRGLTLDERKQVEDEALEQLVTDLLLQQEYRRRGIGVTDAEIQQAALSVPPPALMQSPELQTDGRFDPEKYQRYLRSPNARAQGLLLYLEQYYRTEIPKEKLLSQVVTDVYLTDQRLWSVYQDQHDSASITYAVLRPDMVADSAVQVTDAEVREYFDKNRANLERPGRAVISIVQIPRVVTAADTASVRDRIAALRAEIAGGTSFDDVARRESVDSASAAQGGSLGTYVRGSGFVAPFEQAAFALRPGELSQPVLTPFGYHLIRVDARRGDTLEMRHILLRIAQSDSSATRTDRRADSLANLAASATDPKKFDEAARRLNLVVSRAEAIEGQPVNVDGRMIPSVGTWAFDGAETGEVSELLDAPEGYYLARLDSLREGGEPKLEDVRTELRAFLAVRKKVDALVPRAEKIARASATSSLEAASQADGLTISKTQMFNRTSFVPGIGQFMTPIGAAFALPVGAVSAPIKSTNGVYVIRVERRVNADRATFEAQKAQQRAQMLEGLRQQRVQEFLRNLRESADIDDNRREINAAARQQAS